MAAYLNWGEIWGDIWGDIWALEGDPTPSPPPPPPNPPPPEPGRIVVVGAQGHFRDVSRVPRDRVEFPTLTARDLSQPVSHDPPALPPAPATPPLGDDVTVHASRDEIDRLNRLASMAVPLDVIERSRLDAERKVLLRRRLQLILLMS